MLEQDAAYAAVAGVETTMARFGLYVKFRAEPGQRDALVKVLLASAKMMADAPGCELYVVNSAADEADTVWVTEIWRSAADHERSLSMTGARDLVGQATPLLAGRPERIELHPAGGAGLRD
jgi:quinol monooxygenase YgiN